MTVSDPTTTLEEDLREERIKATLWDPALFARMLTYAWPYWRRILVGTLLVGASTLLWLAPPTLIGALIDLVGHGGRLGPQARLVAGLLGAVAGRTPAEVAATPAMTLLLVFGGLFLLVRVAMFLVDWASTYVLMGLAQRVVRDLRLHVFRHVHGLSLAWLQRHPVGRIVTRTMNDVQAVEDLFGVALVTIFKDVAMLVGIVAFLFLYEARLALVVVGVVPLIVVATVVFRRESRAAYRLWRAAIARLNAFLAEALSGVRVVQLFRKEAANDATYDAIGRDWQAHFLRQRRAWAVYRPVNTTLLALGTGLVLAFGGAAALETARLGAAAEAGGITVGLLVTFLGYAEQFAGPVRDLTEKFDLVQAAMTAGERIFTILDERSEIVESAHPLRPGRLAGRVEFEDVHFAYVPSEPVLRGLTFRIEPGEMVAIVGHTGAGKTTIVNLVSRFWDVTSGRVLVDGHDVRAYALDRLRGGVAMVHQEVFLFAGTVLENLRLGDEDIPLERVKAACEAVQASRFVERLPGGYEATVEEGGKTFSAGERQLLSFARALVFDPAVLVLDEATASVDTHTEELVQRALTRLTRGRTSIVIAHRLSTIRRADRILVLDHGRLVEEGTHEELLRRGGMYRRLYELQFA